MLTKQRIVGVVVLLITLAAMGYALWVESTYHVEPCYLCVLQRAAFIGCGFAALLWLILPVRRWSRYLGGSLLALFALLGVGLAGRQIWLQHLPADKAPACGPGFHYLVDNFPLKDTLPLLLKGDGNCAVVNWRLWSFTMAEWAAVLFVIFFLLVLRVLIKK